MTQEVELIAGGRHRDERGTLSFINDFSLEPVKRFYIIENKTPDIIRAWQGHRWEHKWFYVINGSFEMVLVQPDDWAQPAPDLQPSMFHLEADAHTVLHVPNGFATGFRALDPGSRMIVYSNFSLQESLNDDYRFDPDLWWDWSR